MFALKSLTFQQIQLILKVFQDFADISLSSAFLALYVNLFLAEDCKFPLFMLYNLFESLFNNEFGNILQKVRPKLK